MGSLIAYGTDSHIKDWMHDLIFEEGTVRTLRLKEDPSQLLGLVADSRQQVDAVIIGPQVSEAISLAERIHRIDKSIAIVVLTEDLHLPDTKKRVRFSPFIGNLIASLPTSQSQSVAETLRPMVEKARKKKSYDKIISQARHTLQQKQETYYRPTPALFDKLLDYAPVGIAILNHKGQILGWNKEAHMITKVDEVTALKSTLHTLLFTPNAPPLDEYYRQALKGSEPVKLEIQIGSGDHFQSLEITLGSVENNACPLLMAIIQDKTAQKRHEKEIKVARAQAETANQSKSRFLANMSHEIRTPVGVILGYLDLLENSEVTNEDRGEFIQVIQRNGHQLLRLIDDILDLSKVEAGKLTISKTTLDLKELLHDLESSMSYRAQENGLSFQLKIGDEVPQKLITDGVRLRQILTNLINNAIKFTEKGGVEITVESKGNNLWITVKDTGIGIAPHQAQRLFQPFAQADASVTRKFGGTGLGLVLSKRLAEALGGQLNLIESLPGEGSTFALQIPVKTPAVSGVPRAQKTGHLSPTSTTTAPLSEMKILIVEDSPDNQKLISRFVTQAGAQAELASNGLEALDSASSQNYDLILMDIQMPFCDGLEATRQLREEGYFRPIIALTAHALEEERRKSFSAGCNDHVTKPVDRKQLISIIERYKP